MPSIMDLVREYSELEIKRNERGGMLEPQAEIRYQALKFFLEFELFQIPEQKATYQSASYERRVSHSSLGTNKREVAVERKGGDGPPHSSVEHPLPQDNNARSEELVSVISETSLPVSDEQESPTAVREISPPDLKESIKVENITEVIPPAPQPEEGEDKTIAAAEIVEELPRDMESAQPTPLNAPESHRLIETEDLSSHIDSAFDNVINKEPVALRENVSIIEGVLADLPLAQPEEVGSDISATTPPDEKTPPSPPTLQEVEAEATDINIADILNQIEAATVQPVQPSETVSLNIEGILPQSNVEKTSRVEVGSTQPESPPLNIDFLSEIEKQVDTKRATATVDEIASPSPTIEEILPTDILSPISAPEDGKIITFVDSPVKAAVHMIEGDARRGIIRILNSSQDEIELFTDEKLERSVRLPIKDIKAIFLMRQQEDHLEEEIGGIRIKVRFKDDRSIEGISADYSENAQVFTLSPAMGRQSVKKIIIYRDFVESVETI